MSLSVNDPSVVAEVSTAFALYERALVEKDLATLSRLFAAEEFVVRFGVADEQRGAVELAAWRASQPALPPGRRLRETSYTTFGRDYAVVSTLFTYPDRPFVGRQSQSWVRYPDGWRIVHAHVSEVSTKTDA